MGLYLVPMIGVGTKADPRRPKYVPTLGHDWTAMDFGAAPVCLVEAALTPAEEATLDPNADFFTVPALDTRLTNPQVNAVQTRLENNGIPADWVSTAITWRQLLRTVAAMFQLCQRANVSLANANLDQTMAQIPAATRTRLQDASDSLGFIRSSITGTTTVRQVLKILADQWDRPLTLGSTLL